MRVTIVGGGSAQWAPLLVDDIAITPCLAGGELVLHDLDASRVARTAAYAKHVSGLTGGGLRVDTTTDLGTALDGADHVIVCISTGGFESMGHDLDVSARFGVPMPVGDTAGPAGISRALRNIPVLVGIAREMERRCPDAWMLNVTNPLTVLTRAVARETSIRVVGLCHELGACRFYVSQMLGAAYVDVELRVTGVNHFPVVVGVDVGGTDRFADLVDVAHGRADLSMPLPMLDQVMAAPLDTTGDAPSAAMRAPGWTKQRLREHQAVNYEVLRTFSGLPGADGDHTIEFVPGFLTEHSGFGARWGIAGKTVADRRARQAEYVARLEGRMRREDAPRYRSTELVVDVIEALVTGNRVELPMNIPNRGHCPDLPDDAVVESICIADGDGIRGRDRAIAPPVVAALAARRDHRCDASVAPAVRVISRWRRSRGGHRRSS